MRIVILTVTAVLAVCYTAPAFAEARSFNTCWTLGEQRGLTPGAGHAGFVRDCMAGKIPIATPPVQTQQQNILEAHDFGYCWALAESRGGTTGAAHTTFVRECMAGRQR